MKATVAYKVIVNHSRRSLHISDGYRGVRKNKTIVKTNQLVIVQKNEYYNISNTTYSKEVYSINDNCCPVMCCALLRCAVLCCALLCCAVLCCAVLSGVLRSAMEKGRNRDTCSSFSHRDCWPGVGGHTFSVAWVLWSDKVEVPYTEIRTERDGSLSLILILHDHIVLRCCELDPVSMVTPKILQYSKIQHFGNKTDDLCACNRSGLVTNRPRPPIFKGEIIRLHSYTVCSDVPGIAYGQQ